MRSRVLAGLISCMFAQPLYAQPCTTSVLTIGRNRIWVDEEGTGNVTVVFEAGFGNESGVWANITPKIRAAGARTFVYDRAGLGKSTIDTTAPYSLDNDVAILRSALNACGIEGPIIMVGHSYGGAISLVLASDDDRIKGLVLIEALVPGAWPKSEVDKNLATMRSQYAEVRQQAPALAKVAIPWAEAMPATAQRIDAVRVPESLPIIDIVAEKGMNNPETAKIWQSAHLGFTDDNPHREHVLAVGSSHKVMADQPDLVVKAILDMLQKLGGRTDRSPASG